MSNVSDKPFFDPKYFIPVSAYASTDLVNVTDIHMSIDWGSNEDHTCICNVTRITDGILHVTDIKYYDSKGKLI